MKHSKTAKFFFSLLLIVAIERFCRWQTEGFRLTKVLCEHPHNFSYCTAISPENLKQPFYFLGSGVQFYAFIGKDGKTILKLFKHHHMGLSTDLTKKILPKKFANSLIAAREKRMKHLFRSVRIASDHLTKETGVVYFHVGKTDKNLGTTRIFDKLGIGYEIDFDKVDFVIQKRVDTASAHLGRLFENKEIEQATLAMKQLLKLIEKRSRLGIKNKDGNLLENCGFLEDEPIELDIGSFIYRTTSTNPDPHKKAVLRAKLQLLGWIKKKHPEHFQTSKETLFYEDVF